jgi:dihydroorotate dehydrogenase
MTSLDATILDKLHLADPFMIASSHHTDNEISFGNLVTVAPSALTLKTISNRSGGSGIKEDGLKRDRVVLRYPGGSRLGSFTDGPKKVELWDAPTCLKHIQIAQRLLPTSRLGISVAQGEDYQQIADSLDLHHLHYVELNWKYTFRQGEFARELATVESDTRNFLEVFHALPILVKIPYELLPLLERPELRTLYAMMKEKDAGLLVMNTKKSVVPPSRQPDKKFVRQRGVVFGEYLLLDTFNSLRRLSALKLQGWSIPRLVATGGITDIGAVVDTLAAGAEAVQLCSILDYRKLSVVDILRRQLTKLIADSGAENFEAFKVKLRETDNVEWLNTSAAARSLETYHETVTTRIAQNKKTVIEVFARTLRSETLTLAQALSSSSQGPEQADRVSFLINRANIASFILSHRLLRKRGFSSEAVDDAKEVRQRVRKNPPEFDLVIIPQRVAEAILENHAEDSKPFEITGQVGQSVIEVVGTVESLEQIRTLFHFGGTGSKEVLKILLPLLTSKPDVRELESPREELTPLLTLWKPGDAILARGPLTHLYPLLIDRSLRARWKVVREVPGGLVLIATSRFLDKWGGEAAKRILMDLQELSVAVNADPTSAAREAYDLGFVHHLANLMGANVLA